MTDTTRRRFLQAASSAALVGVAGCSNIGGNNNKSTTIPDEYGPSGNQTSVERVDPAEDGYINKQTGDIKWDQLDGAHDIEYVYAAKEAYNAAQYLLEYCYEGTETTFNELRGQEPDFESANDGFDQASSTAETAQRMHDHAITLLSEIDETAAVEVVEQNKSFVAELETFIDTKLKKFLNEYEAGNNGYVSQHDQEFYNRFEELKTHNRYWPAVQGELKITQTN